MTKCLVWTGSSKKNVDKFGDTSSVRSGGLCIGSPRLVGGSEGGNFKQARIFLHHAVEIVHVHTFLEL